MNTIELTGEQIEEIVLTDLKSILEQILNDPWPCHHDLSESRKDVESFLRVIEYFSRPSDYSLYSKYLDFSKLGGNKEHNSGTIIVDEITENEDGSADMKFTASTEQLQILAGEGFKYLLMKAALGKNDSEIMRLTERGDREEKIDATVKKLNAAAEWKYMY